jgi:hypothetical protein
LVPSMAFLLRLGERRWVRLYVCRRPSQVVLSSEVRPGSVLGLGMVVFQATLVSE